jgi:hypothetical protein
MTIYYSKTTTGFYDSEIHGANIPADAVAITQQAHAELLAGQSAGKIITADSHGAPILQNPPAPTAAQQWSVYQAKARAALTDSDTSMLRIYEAVILGATTMEAADVVAFVKWRQALRAILSTAQPEEIPDALPAMPAYPVGTGSTSAKEAQS